MAHWLFKSEPASWSWEQQVEAGAKGTPWNGVRNHSAKLNLMAMKKGERGFFYHSGEGKAVVGIVEVIKEYYPDDTDASGRFGMVDLKAVKALPQAGHPGGDQGRAEAQGHGPRQQLAPLGAAGDRRRMDADLQHGRGLNSDVGGRASLRLALLAGSGFRPSAKTGEAGVLRKGRSAQTAAPLLAQPPPPRLLRSLIAFGGPLRASGERRSRAFRTDARAPSIPAPRERPRRLKSSFTVPPHRAPGRGIRSWRLRHQSRRRSRGGRGELARRRRSGTPCWRGPG